MFFSGWVISPPTKLAWSHPSKAQSPEYKASEYEDGLVLEPAKRGPLSEPEAFPRASWTIPRIVTRISKEINLFLQSVWIKDAHKGGYLKYG